jgi:tRNA pseudouridine38-40 synthase
MAVYRMTIEYDGSGWHGWQIQAGVPTIQEAIEGALATALRVRTPVVGSGRTDAGVHAEGQVAHFQTAVSVDSHLLLGRLNGILPRSIAVLDLTETSDEFHARYRAVRRSYRYRVSTRAIAVGRHNRVHLRYEPDFQAMNRAAGDLIGIHECSALCRTASETVNRTCHIGSAKWEQQERPGHWDFTIVADRFLHGMVRAVVGTLLEIGSGKRPEEDLPRILHTRERTEAGPAAPAMGLALYEVAYPEDIPSGTGD